MRKDSLSNFYRLASSTLCSSTLSERRMLADVSMMMFIRIETHTTLHSDQGERLEHAYIYEGAKNDREQ